MCWIARTVVAYRGVLAEGNADACDLVAIMLVEDSECAEQRIPYPLGNVLHVASHEVVAFRVEEHGEAPRVFEGD